MVTTAINPFDVISTRLYTQGGGVTVRYAGVWDCAMKTVKAEGFRGVSDAVRLGGGGEERDNGTICGPVVYTRSAPIVTSANEHMKIIPDCFNSSLSWADGFVREHG